LIFVPERLKLTIGLFCGALCFCGFHIEAAALRNRCRRSGLQIGTIDALLAQLCIHHALTLLTTDKDFSRIAGLFPLRV
jgi:predicted nucleic acid-binding protein